MTWTESLSFAAIIGAATVFVLCERRFPYNRGQPFLREGFWTDFVFYALAQNWALGVVIGRIIAWLDGHTAWSSHRLIGGWPILAQVAFFVITHDLYIYLFHRLQHRTPLLWRLHEAHHSCLNVDWLAGSRSHAVEILINQTIEFAPIVLLGASPQVAVIKGAISAVWGMFIHANLDVKLGRLQYVVNGPEMHRWHHADDPEAYDKNFSTKFAFWDWMFGTAYFPDRARRKAQRYGLAEVKYPERFPTAYFQHHLISISPTRSDRGGAGSIEASG
ncbi:MAG TPA: sterol desaturase family protein [Gemmatimonadaceae bacterium]|nr:sterol desaturase family protein [Gemmatimonadaceae bacterium]